MKNIDLAFREITHIDKVRIANFVTYTINTSNSNINAHDGTMNTLLGLLAKGDQNCWAPEERTSDLFNDGDVSERRIPEQSDTTRPIQTPRDPNSLPQGVIQKPGEKAAAEKAAQEAEEKRKADEKAKQLAEDEIKRQQDKQNRKPSLGNKFLKWLGTFTDADE
jgi:cell division protein FtsA